MLLSEFDGFCAGLIVCPDIVLTGEWLPLVWGNEDAPAVDEIEDVQPATDLITGHYNAVAQGLASPVPGYPQKPDNSVGHQPEISGTRSLHPM